jgi:hypothetical protein
MTQYSVVQNKRTKGKTNLNKIKKKSEAEDKNYELKQERGDVSTKRCFK